MPFIMPDMSNKMKYLYPIMHFLFLFVMTCILVVAINNGQNIKSGREILENKVNLKTEDRYTGTNALRDGLIINARIDALGKRLDDKIDEMNKRIDSKNGN